jgi:nicotinamidase/pyrazinamidase
MEALLLVDIQNDFLPGGALAVPNGDEVIAVANKLLDSLPIAFATKDWHPKDHVSFADNHKGHQVGEIITCNNTPQILWPRHCVQESYGSSFPEGLHKDKIQTIVYKGIHSAIDSYSGFYDNAKMQTTELHASLKAANVDTLFIMGLATDYCVKFTVLDACSLGYNTFLVEDGCRGVNLNSQDVTNAIQEMRKAGATIIQSQEVTSLLSI